MSEPTAGFEPRVWRHAAAPHPEIELAHPDQKRAFWRGPERIRAFSERSYVDVNPDRLSGLVFGEKRGDPSLIKAVRPADPEAEYNPDLLSKMERTAPQFNLRNVPRAVLEIDTEFMEWGKHEIPNRRGYTTDVDEVRNAKHEPAVFHPEFYCSNVSRALVRELEKVFVVNDWEQWYGEDKKRLVGAMWLYVPPDGEGKRTRPWPELRIIEHKYWKGRLITEEY